MKSRGPRHWTLEITVYFFIKKASIYKNFMSMYNHSRLCCREERAIEIQKRHPEFGRTQFLCMHL